MNHVLSADASVANLLSISIGAICWQTPCYDPCTVFDVDTNGKTCILSYLTLTVAKGCG